MTTRKLTAAGTERAVLQAKRAIAETMRRYPGGCGFQALDKVDCFHVFPDRPQDRCNWCIEYVEQFNKAAR